MGNKIYNFRFKKILAVILISIFSINTTNAWIGLIAENGDLLNILKWNEMINDKLSKVNLKPGAGITLTNSGSDIFINSISSVIIPYITTTTKKVILSNSTIDLTLDGINFTPTSELIIPGFDGTINSTTVLSPTRLIANITSGLTANNYNLVISNGGTLNTLWSGNGNLLLEVVTDILGTGLAGTYLEDFEVGLGSWVDSGLTGIWTRDSGGTPSNGTGPTTGAGGSTWYMFTEVSAGADANEFGIETSDFRLATSISLDYHMFGTDVGTLSIQTLNDGIWTTVWSISGQQQAAQTDPYINTGNIDLTLYSVAKIRILMNGATGWSGDVAIDNISIISE